MALPTNPFSFGALALDDAFTDRTAELAELRADIENGTDVVIFAPRRLAKAIHDDIATPLFRAKERLRVFSGPRVAPVVTVDPEHGSLGFSFTAGHTREDLDETLERLFELLGRLGAERDRRIALVLDEFQEVVEIDPHLPKLMRAVFQEQPEVAHIYLGSKRHMMRRIFSDENEPFWRSAKPMELGVISPAEFRPFVEARFGSIEPLALEHCSR